MAISSSASCRYVAEGDSITFGYNASPPPTQLNSYATLAAADVQAIVGAARWSYTDFAVSGSTQVQLRARAASVDASLVTGWKNALSVYIGANDMTPSYVGVLGNGISGWLADLAAYLDARRAAGWYVVLCSMLPLNPAWSATWDTDRAVVEGVFYTWAGVHCDALADFYRDPIMGTSAAKNDITLYQDLVHPTQLGHTYLQKTFSPVLQAAFSSQFSATQGTPKMARRSILPGNVAAGLPEIRDALNSANSNFIDLYTNGVDAPQGRLTLTSGTPVMTASVSGATNIYYTPYTGQLCPLFDGANFNMADLGGELGNVTTDATKNPAAVTASQVYDLFVWDDNGTKRLTRSVAWTGNARTMALARLRGILVNAVDILNGPKAFMGTYVGTFASGGGSTVSFVFGVPASTGAGANLNLWNYYNRVTVQTRVTDTQAAYSYTTAVVRGAGGSNNMFINYVIGVAEDCPTFYYQQNVTTAAAVGATAQVSIGDGAVAFELAGTYFAAQAVVAATGTLDVMYNKGMTEPLIGQQAAYALELGDGVNANLFNVGAGGELSGVLRM